jgi:hypothetical protein
MTYSSQSKLESYSKMEGRERRREGGRKEEKN